MGQARTLLAAVLILNCAACLAAEQPQSQALFNGRDLSGWVKMNDAQFGITNANLQLISGTGWLRSAEAYTNYVLEIEWRALESGYDSGILINASTNGVPWPTNAWQVNLERIALGALVKGGRTMVPAENPPMPLNQWVKFRIGVNAPKIWLEVDGEKAWEYEKLDSASGFIGIQAEGKIFEFRNIRLGPFRD